MGPKLRVFSVGLLVGLGLLCVVGTAGSVTPEWAITGGGTGGFEGGFTNATGDDTDHLTLKSLDTSNPIEAMDIQGGNCQTSAGLATCEVDVRPGAGTRFNGTTAQKLVPNGTKFEACTYANPGSAGGACQTVIVGGGGTPTPPRKTEKVIFGLREHSHHVVKNKSGHAVGFLLTNSAGAGSLTVASRPSGKETAVKATGTITFTQSLFSPKDVLILDEDKLSFRVTGGSFCPGGPSSACGYAIVSLHVALSKSVVVADQSGRKKECPAGSKGTVTLADGSPVNKRDHFVIKGCGVDESFRAGQNHATVQVEVVEPSPPA